MQKVLVYIRDNDNCYMQRVEYTFNSEEDEEAFDGSCISFSLLSLCKDICTTSGILVCSQRYFIHYIHNLDSRVRHQRNRSRIIISNTKFIMTSIQIPLHQDQIQSLTSSIIVPMFQDQFISIIL